MISLSDCRWVHIALFGLVVCFFQGGRIQAHLPAFAEKAPSLQEEYAKERVLEAEEKDKRERAWAEGGQNLMIRSGIYQIPGLPLKRGAIGFINGIDTSFEVTRLYAKKLSHYAGSAEVTYVYNGTHSFVRDLSACLIGHFFKITTPPVLLLLEQWKEFIRKQGSEAKFLQIAHSQGAIHVKNALLAADDTIRERIIVVTIAPGALIPSHLCYAAYNYASERDLIPYLDRSGHRAHSEALTLLEPHPQAPFFDHGFDSPTYAEVLERITQGFVEEYGNDSNTFEKDITSYYSSDRLD